MAIDVPTFKKCHPEFRITDDNYILEWLTRAQLFLDEDLFGDKFETAVFLQAAHMMALSPQGIAAKLVPEKAGVGVTTYSTQLKQMQLGVAGAGFRVT